MTRLLEVALNYSKILKKIIRAENAGCQRAVRDEGEENASEARHFRMDVHQTSERSERVRITVLSLSV